MKKFPVGPEECGIIFESAQIADLGDGFLLPQKLPCHEKALAVNVAADGIASFLFKHPHKVVFTDEKFLRDQIHTQIPGQMLVDKLRNGKDLGMKMAGGKEAPAVGQGGAVQVNDKF